MEATRWDKWVLYAGGSVLLALAAGFLWRDLEIPTEGLLALAALGVGGFAISQRRDLENAFAPGLLLVSAVVGGVWFVLTKSPLLIAGLGVVLGAALLQLGGPDRHPKTDEARLASALRWHGLSTSIVAATGAAYFQFLTIGFASEHVGRRLVITLAWAALGVFFVIRARYTGRHAMRDAGFVLVALSFAKTLFYDLTHLDGFWRIAVLAAGGAVFLLGGLLTARPQSAPARAQEQL